MKIVVGLGNPDKKYERTYHNLGFIAADNLAQKLGFSFHKKLSLRGAIAQGKVGAETVVLVKPTTYMNLSGECVKAVLKFFNAKESDLIVIYDDVDIDIGQIRVRQSGSPGTHNGMRNISLNLGSNNFARIRIGSKPKNKYVPIIDYVLSDIAKDEYDLFDAAIDRAAKCALDFLDGESFEKLMCKYNAAV